MREITSLLQTAIELLNHYPSGIQEQPIIEIDTLTVRRTRIWKRGNREDTEPDAYMVPALRISAKIRLRQTVEI